MKDIINIEQFYRPSLSKRVNDMLYSLGAEGRTKFQEKHILAEILIDKINSFYPPPETDVPKSSFDAPTTSLRVDDLIRDISYSIKGEENSLDELLLILCTELQMLMDGIVLNPAAIPTPETERTR